MDSVPTAGSSPLTRGKLRDRVLGAGVNRLIPAHAGKTTSRVTRAGAVTAHPRSRGENVASRAWPLIVAGSSPLTRGKLDAEEPPALRGRLIPAHAGKTRGRGTCRTRPAAHPRSRGENTRSPVSASLWAGSSPLTRGKPELFLDPLLQARLIPAHAGKTRHQMPARYRGSAHPRSRGENSHRLCLAFWFFGSSPLTRGKPRRERQAEEEARLIPAHAGKTPRPRATLRGQSAHPRSRGENHAASTAARKVSGSSPLTRGKRCPEDQSCRRRRLIPAHAGKTLGLARNAERSAAHPRSRGENCGYRIGSDALIGSSPLTRGKRTSAG